MPKPRRCWLLKSEPTVFSIQDLAACPAQTTCWDGVRNYQARNFLRDAMSPGDRILFYHSNAQPAAVVGTAVVVSKACADPTAWQPGHPHFDPKASPENPIWQMVDIRLEEIFPRSLPLEELRTVPALKAMELLRRGSRLSVQPVTEVEFAAIVKLAHSPPRGRAAAQKAAAKTRRSAGRGRAAAAAGSSASARRPRRP